MFAMTICSTGGEVARRIVPGDFGDDDRSDTSQLLNIIAQPNKNLKGLWGDLGCQPIFCMVSLVCELDQ